MKIRTLLLSVFLCVLAGLQARVTFRDYVLPWSEQIYEIRLQPAWERAGRLSVWVGPERTDFIGYLRSVLPSDATVIVPGRYRDPWDAYPYLMQYYLYPRKIVACADNDLVTCIRNLPKDELVYILKSFDTDWEIPAVLGGVGYLETDGQGVYRVR